MATLLKLRPVVAATLIGFCGLMAAGQANAFDFQSTVQSVKDIWNNGQNELYIPVHTYHVRSAYDPQKIAEFNENPWGIGFGKGIKDADRDWKGLYAMEFQDSHRRIQPIAGYGYLKDMVDDGAFQMNLGFTAFITAREDIHHYLPIPGILPMASVEYKKTSLMATYLPGHHNNGNVFFFVAKVNLGK